QGALPFSSSAATLIGYHIQPLLSTAFWNFFQSFFFQIVCCRVSLTTKLSISLHSLIVNRKFLFFETFFYNLFWA
ncbi:hypothetical protein, partial [uncultured Acetatifactor sp.]|uniref:hypothetical protein n=1 Tax=uncultured Acetatifactor sp. TaxID=1671927 RepID=UPI002608036C